MDAAYKPEDLAFRDEVRAFLKTAMPDHIRRQTQLAPSYVSKEMTRDWHKILYNKGWIAPNWPVEFGGTGWTAVQKHIFDEEVQATGAPRLSPFGLTMVGPVIYTFGTEAQKAQHLPGILSGDTFWCQGYSEPGSGSDLASLKTRAVRDGDDYVVNGQKIWTSHAHHADWIFALVRTDPNAPKKQEGISFLLIDLKTPGIEIRPIISMDGGHYLNEVFFTDVRVPASNRIGEENKGWTYAKFLLGNERTGVAQVGKSAKKLEAIIAAAKQESDGQGGTLWDDPAFRARIATINAKLAALGMSNLRVLAQEAGGGTVGPEASLLKINGSEIEQALNETFVEALGNYAQPYDLEALRIDTNVETIGPDHGRGVMTEHLLRRAATIYGGTNEVQRDIIAKRVLGL
ncbi:MAG: acyl-CoA dehydrogenase family protein [Alphaproteobacteria bacterium]|nr:acyl-CoA dehydrogenase family protein [Alphaproteobacteria bacterium]